MADIDIRREGRAGRITLTRPDALNALTYDMCLRIAEALSAWRDDPQVALVLIDGDGPRAFCSGGDIVEMYETGRAGNFGYGHRFWADEYRMNAAIADFPKPVVSFLHGYTMGGGVGVGCHASHRVVCETSQIAMPECGIGLVPDVGGSALLARAPGRLGAYFGTTGARMGPGEAILVGFADLYLPQAAWPDVKAALVATGKVEALQACEPPPEASVLEDQARIDALFADADAAATLTRLETSEDTIAQSALKAFRRASPLSVACTLRMLSTLGKTPTLKEALQQEYRFTWRAAEKADFLEGIRAQIIDKDRTPQWRHASVRDVTVLDVAAMLAPLGRDELIFEGGKT
ncbi:enoyl-CoA hydratase/isomerase family protein [Tropicimonas sp. S265A]|uniref:enoyl-CoA hydratase/isomerase family protein n=1 Tax=Tropicimonas sp. S265A TaxID=3415134 RepID=UPI003C7AD247